MATSSKATKRFFAIISLSDRKYRLYTFTAVLLALAVIPVSWLEQALPPLSVCHLLVGEHCYSVGITRGVSSLLKGNLDAALTYNPLSLAVLAIMLGIIAHDAYYLRKTFE